MEAGTLRRTQHYSLTTNPMLATILTGLSPFILNIVVGITKWTGGVQSTGGKRFLLAVFSVIGVVAYDALMGQPVDMNSLTSLLQTAIEALVAFLAAHGSYHLFWQTSAPAPVTVPTTAEPTA
jgi:hypothetical protein